MHLLLSLTVAGECELESNTSMNAITIVIAPTLITVPEADRRLSANTDSDRVRDLLFGNFHRAFDGELRDANGVLALRQLIMENCHVVV